ncbi:hypothetical protein ACIBI9_00545 [Nonomuraea sp. NPDC050451]|uniref:hypothetical protein n=1 Tax=Nonomuraea sp. NPDC050451 TaxID=3364364 RepID=UPI0037BA1345
MAPGAVDGLEDSAARRLPRAVLTLREPGPLPTGAARVLDEFLAGERLARSTTDAASLPHPLPAPTRPPTARRCGRATGTAKITRGYPRNGFARDRIFTRQGDYGRYQCTTPCTPATWNAEPLIALLLATYDPAPCPAARTAADKWRSTSGSAPGSSTPPTCPPAAPSGTRLLILEFGTGFNPLLDAINAPHPAPELKETS